MADLSVTGATALRPFELLDSSFKGVDCLAEVAYLPDKLLEGRSGVVAALLGGADEGTAALVERDAPLVGECGQRTLDGHESDAVLPGHVPP